MSDRVRELVDERKAELMGRLKQLEQVRSAGEGASTRALEVGLLESELGWNERAIRSGSAVPTEAATSPTRPRTAGRS